MQGSWHGLGQRVDAIPCVLSGCAPPSDLLPSFLCPDLPPAGQVLELAVLLAVRQGDEAAFERNYAQLRVYYRQAPRSSSPFSCLSNGPGVLQWQGEQTLQRLWRLSPRICALRLPRGPCSDARSLLPPSSQEAALTGLNLLRLLVANRIAEFHTELEASRHPPATTRLPRSAFPATAHWHYAASAARARPCGQSPWAVPLLSSLALTLSSPRGCRWCLRRCRVPRRWRRWCSWSSG